MRGCNLSFVTLWVPGSACRFSSASLSSSSSCSRRSRSKDSARSRVLRIWFTTSASPCLGAEVLRNSGVGIRSFLLPAPQASSGRLPTR